MTADDDLQRRLIELAAELLGATQEGVVSWSETDARDTYLSAGLSNSMTIGRVHGLTIELRVLNPRGTVVASLATGQTTLTESDSMRITGPASWNKQLEDLLSAARRSALNPEGVVDDILADLREQQREQPTDQ
jgi:hypothetical protein